MSRRFLCCHLISVCWNGIWRASIENTECQSNGNIFLRNRRIRALRAGGSFFIHPFNIPFPPCFVRMALAGMQIAHSRAIDCFVQKIAKIKLDCEWNAGWPECRRRNTSEKCQPFNYLIIKHSVRRRLDGEFVRRVHDTCVYGRKAGRQHHHHHQHRTTPHHYRQITTENWEELSDVLLARLTFSRNTPKMAQQNA